ncbi:X-element\ORF2 [Symbiodinium sp. CCMP2592]|nr:X-element\ORF2 [Symbiodinium sp. CCMP2592]
MFWRICTVIFLGSFARLARQLCHQLLGRLCLGIGLPSYLVLCPTCLCSSLRRSRTSGKTGIGKHVRVGFLLWLIASSHVHAAGSGPAFQPQTEPDIGSSGHSCPPDPEGCMRMTHDAMSLVQVRHSRRFRGESLLTVGTVPRVHGLHELEGPLINAAAGLPNPGNPEPHCLRSIAVFVAGHTSGGPIQVAIDTRLHGVQLHRVILQLVGLSFQLWHVHELQTLLPALPLEQVVVIPNDVAWNQACIPVDLCALGGTISVVRGPRQQLASYFLVAAARSQDLALDLANTVCRTRHGFFEPECQALLLHGNDALQALPVYAEESRGSRSPTHSIEHRMAVSSFDGTDQGFEMIVNPHARAVIITLTGLIFYDTDPFHDRDELLREAYEAVGDIGPLRLQRVWPHMPGLPPLQFAQAEQSALQVTYVVDARAIGGEISLVYLGPQTPVADVLMQLPTFRQAGPNGPEILRGIHDGHLRVLHHEVVISPATSLDSEPPVCLTLVPHRRPHMGQARARTETTQPTADTTLPHPGGNPAAPAPRVDPSAAGWISLGLLRQGWLRNVLLAGYFVTLVSAGRADSEPTDLTGTARTMHIPRFQPDLAYHDASMHLRLQQGFVSGLEGDFLPIVSGYGTLHHDLEVNACLWAPEHFEEFRVPGSMSRHRLRETLTEKARSWGRGQIVPAATSPHALAVHFVAVTTESGHRTTLFAADTSCVCIDVPREAPQDFLLRQCEAKLRSDCVRFLPMATPLRHGDVIRVELDKEFGRADASRFLLYSEIARPSRWLDVLPYRQIAVLTAHRGVQILHDTVTGRSPHGAVQAWLRERNYAPRQAVEVLELSNLVGFPCFHTIVAGATNAVLWLHDHFGNPNTGLAVTAVGSFSVAVDVLEACARTSTSARAVCSLVSTADLRTVQTVHGLCARGSGTKTLFVRMAFDLQALPGDSISVHRQRATVLRTRIPPGIARSGRNPPSRQGAAATRTASPVRSPSPRATVPVCHPSHLQDADGDLPVIRCEAADVTCVVRCGPHMQIWALKIEGRWNGACTPQVSWDAVVSLGGLTPWDAADLVVTTEDRWWRYPQDLSTATGRCLTLHQTCESGREVPGQGAVPSVHQAASVASVALWALGKAPLKWLSIGWILGVTARPAQQESPTSEESSNPNATDSEPSPPFSTAAVEDQRDECWNPPLTPALEASAMAAMLPIDPQQIYPWLCSLGAASHDLRLWTAMRGPALVRWTDTASEFDQALRLGGFCPEDHELFAAADTDPHTLELVAVPRGQGSWWIVRDLLSRELLRPVTWLPCAGHRLAVTTNSAGEVNALAHHSRLARCTIPPQGGRATVVNPVDGFTAALGQGGLILALGSAWRTAPLLSTISLACLLLAELPGAFGLRAAPISLRPGRQLGLVAMWLLDVEVWTGQSMQQTVQIPQVRVYTAIRIWIVDHPSPIQLSGPPWPTEEEIHGIVQLGGFGVERGTLIPIRGTADPAIYDAAYVPLHFGHSGITACLVQLDGRAAVFAFDAQHFDWDAFGRWVGDVFREATLAQPFGFRLGNCGYSYGQAVQIRNGDLVVLHCPRHRHTAYLAPPDPWALESPPPLPARMLQTGPTREAPINAYLVPQSTEGVGVGGHRRWALSLAVGPSSLQPALPASPASSAGCGIPTAAAICSRNSCPSLQACPSLITQRHAAVQTEPGTATLDDVWWAIQDMQCQLAALAAQAHVPAAEGLPSAEVPLLQGRSRDADTTSTFRGTENSGSLRPALLVPGICLLVGVTLPKHSAARTWLMPLAFLLPIWGAPTLAGDRSRSRSPVPTGRHMPFLHSGGQGPCGSTGQHRHAHTLGHFPGRPLAVSVADDNRARTSVPISDERPLNFLRVADAPSIRHVQSVYLQADASAGMGVRLGASLARVPLRLHDPFQQRGCAPLWLPVGSPGQAALANDFLQDHALLRGGQRWYAAGPYLTWRSGHEKGQYGVEIWVHQGAFGGDLQLQDWRIVASSPRYLIIRCQRSAFPVVIISAHAPHADRPQQDIVDFWSALRREIHALPLSTPLLIGVDANADFTAADSEGQLIGDLVDGRPPREGDLQLLSFAQDHFLEAPATWSRLHQGQTWTWQHSSGKCRRHDHILFSAGGLRATSSQCLPEFDIINSTLDHVPISCSLHICAEPVANAQDRRRRPIPPDSVATAIASRVWEGFSYPGDPEKATAALTKRFHRFARAEQRPARVVPRQPYISDEALEVLTSLKERRRQLRSHARVCSRNLLHLAFRIWSTPDRPRGHVRQCVRNGHRAYARTWLVVLRLKEHAHWLARRDKAAHFQQLTQSATDFWLDTGRAMEATHRLRWASKRAAERRKVFAAGGHDIDADLLRQFQQQEDGQRLTAQELQAELRKSSVSSRRPCPGALPSLLDVEHQCRRQKLRKAPGPDRISNGLWKGQPVAAAQWLWMLCADIAGQGQEPPQFKAALVCALHKKGPASVPSNYRSIALLNGIAKIWHGHVRHSLGQQVLGAYHPLQLGGRRGVHTGFAVASFRSLVALSDFTGRSWFALFLDVQAAYYEADRQLLFGHDHGRARQREASRLVSSLLTDGVLRHRGMAEDVCALLEDCVRCSHWSLCGHDAIILAGRGSRPGDGLADVLFGAIFAQILDDVETQLVSLQIGHRSASEAVGGPCRPIQIAWADDLSVLVDADSATQLADEVPVVTRVVVETAEMYRLRVNLGPGKTEGLLHLRGPGAPAARAALLLPSPQVPFSPGRTLRLVAEYKYLGVPQTAPDNGRRDAEASVQRGQAAWSQANGLMRSPSLPVEVKVAWFTGRVLPAAYSSLATALVNSGRVWTIYQGFFDRCQRSLVASWSVSHHLTREALDVLVPAATPQVATTLCRARLAVQIATAAPAAVLDLVEASCERDLSWTSLLKDAVCTVGTFAGLSPDQLRDSPMRICRAHERLLRGACRRFGKFGSGLLAFHRLWRSRAIRAQTGTIGQSHPVQCPTCGWIGRTAQALAAHRHRKHGTLARATELCNGTTCSWCLRDFHSSDRLKYHIATSAGCRLPLEISVGAHHQYGSGTKRRGPQQHRRLPPIQLCGPRNATPAERQAFDNDQPWDAAALLVEWEEAQASPEVEGTSHTGAVESEVETAPGLPASASVLAIAQLAGRSFFFQDQGQAPSPLWSGLRRGAAGWWLPHTWQHLARFWQAMADSDALSPAILIGYRAATRSLATGHDVPAHCPVSGVISATGPELLLRHTLTFLHLARLVPLGHALCSDVPPSSSLRAALGCICPDAAWSLTVVRDHPAWIFASLGSSLSRLAFLFRHPPSPLAFAAPHQLSSS